jgi:hypothetical protein
LRRQDNTHQRYSIPKTAIKMVTNSISQLYRACWHVVKAFLQVLEI